MDDYDLSQVKGLGPKSIERLTEKTIGRVSQIATMRPSKLADIIKVNKKKAGEIVSLAKAMALETAIQIKSGEEILQERLARIQKIPTGSSKLDNILQGGIWTDALTGLFGEFATGKTQIAHQLPVNCKKYLNGATAYVATEPHSFLPERIAELAKMQGVDFDLKEDLIGIESNIVSNPDMQKLSYEMIERKIEERIIDGRRPIKLIVVDSFIAKFRSDEKYQGRENFPERSQELGRHFGYLQYLADKYNVAVVLTFQVMGTPDAGGTLHNIMKFGIKRALVGGHTTKHSPTFWIALDQISARDRTWKAIVIDGPVERADCLFKITNKGITDAR